MPLTVFLCPKHSVCIEKQVLIVEYSESKFDTLFLILLFKNTLFENTPKLSVQTIVGSVFSNTYSIYFFRHKDLALNFF